jgi:glutathione S-transferase
MSARSPYARKVHLLLLEKGLAFETNIFELADRTPEFMALSPLGKVPLFVDEDGTRVFDSSVIAEYLEDRYPEPALLGHGVQERLEHRLIDELGDTLADQAVALWQANERNDAGGAQKAKALMERALAAISGRIATKSLPVRCGLGQISLLSALGYLAVRHGNGHLERHPELSQLIASYASRPSILAAPAPTK